MPKILLIVELQPKPGLQEQLVTLIRPIGEAARLEAGTLSFTIGTDSDAGTVWLSESYRDQTALDHHRASEPFQNMVTKIGDLLAAPFKMAEMLVAFDLDT
jgi:quinol monooxygenase YgiN